MKSEKEIQRLMKATNSTREEVLDMLACDERIDKGEKLFELADELKAGAKKARQAERKTVASPKREKQADEAKRFLIDTMLKYIPGEKFDILNPEREFTFFYQGKKYKITLACPRS